MAVPSPGRGISQANKDAGASKTVRDVLFADLDFETGLVYFCTAPFLIKALGNDYLGAGQLAGASVVKESGVVQDFFVNLTLNGIPTEVVAIGLGTRYQGRPATLRLGFLNENESLIADPFILWKGRMDNMAFGVGDTASVTLRVESPLAQLRRAPIQRYSDVDQQKQFPGDTFFQDAAGLVGAEIVWPSGTLYERDPSDYTRI